MTMTKIRMEELLNKQSAEIGHLRSVNAELDHRFQIINVERIYLKQLCQELAEAIHAGSKEGRFPRAG